MGLDMYAYCTEAPIPDTDCQMPDDAHEIACWRKHPNLHGWMEELYRDKGGEEEIFNCATLQLLADDIDELEKAVLAGELPHTTGFFFGESLPEDKDADIAFIAAARKALEEGKSVFYTSWW